MILISINITTFASSFLHMLVATYQQDHHYEDQKLKYQLYNNGAGKMGDTIFISNYILRNSYYTR